MPTSSSNRRVVRFEPRVPVLIGTILLVGVLGESGMDWSKCGSDQDLISACALEIDALPELVQGVMMETENG
ncbi:hypothetical protein [Marinibacterium profundimaris]|uniref:hypothetical protein n=1 Tax=Marinibacterium profundimaris TaxID=1679460 RepID=UPI00118164CF|nr:hypothetical protein [Marinibacterium profundimaris]